MKALKGKKANNLVYAKQGLLEESNWKHALKNRPAELVCRIRKELSSKVRGLNEKFNRNSRYFGYWMGDDKDRLYIYVQKKYLRIDLCIDRQYEKNVRKDGFEVVFVNNFQGRNNWLTGWRIPHTTQNIKTVLKWLCKAFE
jgi:hypothetical protein